VAHVDLFCTLRRGILNVFACCSFWEVMLKISLSMTVPQEGLGSTSQGSGNNCSGADFHESSKMFFLPCRLLSLLLEFFCPFDLLFFFLLGLFSMTGNWKFLPHWNQRETQVRRTWSNPKSSFYIEQWFP
jgi:hypothetical protein